MKKILIFLLISNSFLFSQSKDFESFFRGEEEEYNILLSH